MVHKYTKKQLLDFLSKSDLELNKFHDPKSKKMRMIYSKISRSSQQYDIAKGAKRLLEEADKAGLNTSNMKENINALKSNHDTVKSLSRKADRIRKRRQRARNSGRKLGFMDTFDKVAHAVTDTYLNKGSSDSLTQYPKTKLPTKKKQKKDKIASSNTKMGQTKLKPKRKTTSGQPAPDSNLPPQYTNPGPSRTPTKGGNRMPDYSGSRISKSDRRRIIERSNQDKQKQEFEQTSNFYDEQNKKKNEKMMEDKQQNKKKEVMSFDDYKLQLFEEDMINDPEIASYRYEDYLESMGRQDLMPSKRVAEQKKKKHEKMMETNPTYKRAVENEEARKKTGFGIQETYKRITDQRRPLTEEELAKMGDKSGIDITEEQVKQGNKKAMDVLKMGSAIQGVASGDPAKIAGAIAKQLLGEKAGTGTDPVNQQTLKAKSDEPLPGAERPQTSTAEGIPDDLPEGDGSGEDPYMERVDFRADGGGFQQTPTIDVELSRGPAGPTMPMPSLARNTMIPGNAIKSNDIMREQNKQRSNMKGRRLVEEIKAFRLLYSNNIKTKKFRSLASRKPKSLVELRRLHKDYEEEILNYFQHGNLGNLKLGVLIAPEALNLNVPALQNMLGAGNFNSSLPPMMQGISDAPLNQPPVNQDEVEGKPQVAGATQDVIARDVHYQEGGVKHIRKQPLPQVQNINEHKQRVAPEEANVLGRIQVRPGLSRRFHMPRFNEKLLPFKIKSSN